MESNKTITTGITKPHKKGKTIDTYHDTEMLLKKYRKARLGLKTSQEDHQSAMEEEYGMTITEYLEQLSIMGMDLDSRGRTKLESWARTLARTNQILKLVDRMVEVMRDCEADGQIYYSILYHAYLSPTAPEDVSAIVSKVMKDSPRFQVNDYYPYRNRAIKSLGEILWGYTSKDMLELENSLFTGD